MAWHDYYEAKRTGITDAETFDPWSACLDCGQWLKYGDKTRCMCPRVVRDTQHRCPLCLRVASTIVASTGTEACGACWANYLEVTT